MTQTQDSKARFQALVAGLPKEFAQVHLQAQKLFKQGRFAEAQTACYVILGRYPQHAESHFILGLINGNLGRVSKASVCFERAAKCDNSKPEYKAQLARCLVELGYFKRAAAVADAATLLSINDAIIFDTLGCVYSGLHQHHIALDYFRQAVDLAPKNPQYQFNLATARQFVGELELAEQGFSKTLQLKPDHYKAYWSLSTLKKQTAASNNIAELEQALTNHKDNHVAEICLSYALAKEYEDLKNYDKSFEYLQRGGAVRRRTLTYSVEEDKALFAQLQQVFTNEYLHQAPAGYSNSQPIFIVGMPRTGHDFAGANFKQSFTGLFSR